MPVLPSYRNQSIKMLCKSVDWFLYEGNTGSWWVNWMKDLKLKKWTFCIFALSNLFQMFYTVTLLKTLLKFPGNHQRWTFLSVSFQLYCEWFTVSFTKSFRTAFFHEPSGRFMGYHVKSLCQIKLFLYNINYIFGYQNFPD